MTKEAWFRYYSRENKMLFDLIRYIKFGQITVEIRECRPVKVSIGKAFRLNKEKDLNELGSILKN